jgi:hypothetical protein
VTTATPDRPGRNPPGRTCPWKPRPVRWPRPTHSPTAGNPSASRGSGRFRRSGKGCGARAGRLHHAPRTLQPLGRPPPWHWSVIAGAQTAMPKRRRQPGQRHLHNGIRGLLIEQTGRLLVGALPLRGRRRPRLSSRRRARGRPARAAPPQFRGVRHRLSRARPPPRPTPGAPRRSLTPHRSCPRFGGELTQQRGDTVNGHRSTGRRSPRRLYRGRSSRLPGPPVLVLEESRHVGSSAFSPAEP